MLTQLLMVSKLTIGFLQPRASFKSLSLRVLDTLPDSSDAASLQYMFGK